MANLDNKPDTPFKAGDPVSASKLEAMRQAIKRQIVGAGTTDIEQLGDRLLIKSTDPGARNNDVSGYIAPFVVVEEFDDYLKCASYQHPNDGTFFTGPEYDPTFGSTATFFTYVAKPLMLQRRYWDGKTINGVLYAWTAIGERTADGTAQKAKYAPGEIIQAKIGVTGLVGPDDVAIGWIDLNNSGLSYVSDGGTIEGDTTFEGDVTVEGDVDMEGGDIDINASTNVNLGSGFQLRFIGLGGITFRAWTELCGDVSWCHLNYTVTGDIDDLVLPVDVDGYGAIVLHLTGTPGDFSISGMVPTREGQIIAIDNGTDGVCRLLNENAMSLTNNRFTLPAGDDMDIVRDGGVICRRHTPDLRWRVLYPYAPPCECPTPQDFVVIFEVDQTPWTVPDWVPPGTPMLVQCWGGGGAGGNGSPTGRGGGGGGGGGYSEATFTVQPGDEYDVFVGDAGVGAMDVGGSSGGDSVFRIADGGAVLALALGGAGGQGGIHGYGGGAGGTGAGDATFSGGAGGDGHYTISLGSPPIQGGGGGSSASWGGDGTSGEGADGIDGRAGGTAPPGGGDGGDGMHWDGVGLITDGGTPGRFPGGGGGGGPIGSDSSDSKGQNGAPGQIIVVINPTLSPITSNPSPLSRLSTMRPEPYGLGLIEQEDVAETLEYLRMTPDGTTLETSGTTLRIKDDGVTYTKMQNVSATDRVLGRSSSGAGNVEEIPCTAAGRALLDDVDEAAQRTTLGLGTLATQSGTFSGTSSGTNTGDQSITVGTVTDVPYGDPPTVTNSGTTANPVLDFEIPAGEPGTDGVDGVDGVDGATGPTGPTGAAGPNTVTAATTTNLTGILKGDGANVGTATAGTDYLAPAAIGSTVQAYDADLAAIAGLATDPFGRDLLTKADGAAVRAYIGATGTGTTVGQAIFTATNPSAIRFLRVNADNSIDLLSASDFRTAISAIGGTVVTRETPSGTINGSNPTFTLANTPTAGTEHLYLNGILQDSGSGNDYTISGGTITMLNVPISGDKLRVSYSY